MKKFFELSVTSRKSVEGNVVLSANAATKENNELGRLDIRLLNDGIHSGIFFKYTPVEGSNPDDVIAKVKLTGRKPSEIGAALTAVRSAIKDVVFERTDMDFAEKLVTTAILSSCIQPEAEMILIPSSSSVQVTNGIISKVVNDEWLGVEVRIPSDIQEKIANLANSEEKEQQDYSQMFRAAMKNAMSNNESSHTEQ